MSGEPFSKDAQLARGERRYRRKVASPKQWQAIIAAKSGPCRVYGDGYFLTVRCDACNREPGTRACSLCTKIEYAERSVNGAISPQLGTTTRVEYHHLVPRAQGGDDVEDNIVPLSGLGHLHVTVREPHALAALAASLTHSETAYLLDKIGEAGTERLFGVAR